ncbi:AraC-type DNA-binding protein [Dethiosulfatibacter aminovorans DSM 17477]|uniref:AraC-type DNA-binding protein n=1 Tax=Dethiosulfatibacter aminovorans DSM 17477 TaxID=1121476 RepID=A0A1M6G2V4_9FIRM|nr:AraC family transcriptional regulator [Dethiosulfatibacter aminovorans]SHJ04296.1 AraC-type DNA-binding protein [Dethiosulfatibacter aminovorans DSM 17477]
MIEQKFDIWETSKTFGNVSKYNIFTVRNNGVIFVSKIDRFYCRKCKYINSTCIKKWSSGGEISAKLMEPYYYLCPMNYTFIICSNYSVVDDGAVIIGPMIVEENVQKDLDKNPFDDMEKPEGSESVDNVTSIELTSLAEVLFAVMNIRTKKELIVNRKKQILQSELNENVELYQKMSHNYESIFDLENKLINAVSSCDSGESDEIMNRLITVTYIEEKSNIERIKKRFTQTIYLISRSVLEEYMEYKKIEKLNLEYMRKLNMIYGREDIYLWLKDSIESLIDEIRKTSSHKNNMVIYKIQKYVNENYTENISLKDISEKLGMSYNYLSYLFNNEMDMKFKDYLRKIRINKSIEFLESSDYEINRIALEVGFANQSYFTKAFKRETGITPKKYRLTKGI